MAHCPQVRPNHIPPIMMDPFGFGNMLNQNFWNQVGQVFEEIAEQLNQNCDTSAAAACSASSSKNQTAADSGSSPSSINGDTYEVKVDVKHFKPKEINVKLVGENTLIIEGKHEEKSDGNGFVARSFTRRYLIPDSYDTLKIESQLGLDGFLTIKAPRKPIVGVNGDKIIPITLTHNLSSNPVIVTQPLKVPPSSITKETVKDGNNQPIVVQEKPEATKSD